MEQYTLKKKEEFLEIDWQRKKWKRKNDREKQRCCKWFYILATGAIYWVENAEKSEGLVERRNIKHSILDTLNLKNF